MTNSGVVLKGDITWPSNCKSINWLELTGAYSASNPGGWNSPRPDIDTALTATLDITLQNGTVIPQIDLFDTFPTDDTQLAYQVLNTVLGYASEEKIPSQVITAIYTVTGDDSGGIGEYSETVTIELPILCTLECCVNKMAATYKLCKCTDECKCGGSDFTKAWNTLEAIKNSFLCDPPKIQRAKDLIEQLTDICNRTGCGCV